MIWKKIWLDHFSENYNFEYVFNTNFFLPIKFRDFEGSIIGDKDIVDYNNILYKDNDTADFEDLLNKIL